MKYQRDAEDARRCVDELIDLARAAEVKRAADFNEEAQTALEDCRRELLLCIDALEEEIGSLRSGINALTDSRWDDPHP